MPSVDFRVWELPWMRLDLAGGVAIPAVHPMDAGRTARISLEAIRAYVLRGVTTAEATGVAGAIEVWVWDDFSAGSGTSFTLSQTPADPDRVDVYLTGARLTRIEGSLGFTLADKAMTLGLPKDAGQSLVVSYPMNYQLPVWIYDDFTGQASATFTLSADPEDPDHLDLFLTGARLMRVEADPGPTEFTLSGRDGALGLTRKVSDTLIARYPSLGG